MNDLRYYKKFLRQECKYMYSSFFETFQFTGTLIMSPKTAAFNLQAP